jgi:hypothetical protein
MMEHLINFNNEMKSDEMDGEMFLIYGLFAD